MGILARIGAVLRDVLLAFDNLRAQKIRTLLTALGIVFGVGSVIGMLAIAAGAREESLRFIEQLGVRNVLVDSRQASSGEELQQRRRSSPGLTERDVRVLEAKTSRPSRSCRRARVFTRRGCCPSPHSRCRNCSASGPPTR
jgi:putative ABC transport system permease protein